MRRRSWLSRRDTCLAAGAGAAVSASASGFLALATYRDVSDGADLPAWLGGVGVFGALLGGGGLLSLPVLALGLLWRRVRMFSQAALAYVLAYCAVCSACMALGLAIHRRGIERFAVRAEPLVAAMRGAIWRLEVEWQGELFGSSLRYVCAARGARPEAAERASGWVEGD